MPSRASHSVAKKLSSIAARLSAPTRTAMTTRTLGTFTSCLCRRWSCIAESLIGLPRFACWCSQ